MLGSFTSGPSASHPKIEESPGAFEPATLGDPFAVCWGRNYLLQGEPMGLCDREPLSPGNRLTAHLAIQTDKMALR